MNSEERLNRVLAAKAAPAKDMHFSLLVMRRAEEERFRAAMSRRLIWGAVLASLMAVVVLAAAGLMAENPRISNDLVLALGGLGAVWALSRGAGRAVFRRARS